MAPASSPSQRFVLLDGLRGIAALFIVQRHATELLGDELPSSYLGVDLFFALSGFVLAHAYSAALTDGRMSTLSFMKARLFRLYPLYGLALLLMTAYFATLYVLGVPTPLDDLHRSIEPGELAIAVVTGLLFVPAPFSLTLNGALFLVHPAWSLFNELIANLVYGRWGFRAGGAALLAVIVTSALLLIIAACEFGRLHAGFRWNQMYAGMGRVFFSFFMGVMIYRSRSPSLQLSPFLAIACLLVVVAVLAFPTPKSWRAFFDLIVVLAGWPALLFVASRYVPGRAVSTLASFLGTASYAVYVLHVPVLVWAQLLLPQMTDDRAMPYAGLVCIAALTMLCWYLTIAFDQPLQRWFRKRRYGQRRRLLAAEQG